MEIKKIRDKILSCRKCELWKTRKNPVFGEGNTNAKIMFVGEAPGYNEDKTGMPFCGKAGKILDELLCSVNIEREEIFITNVLKCRPT
jgi:DNA polymerase